MLITNEHALCVTFTIPRGTSLIYTIYLTLPSPFLPWYSTRYSLAFIDHYKSVSLNFTRRWPLGSSVTSLVKTSLRIVCDMESRASMVSLYQVRSERRSSEGRGHGHMVYNWPSEVEKYSARGDRPRSNKDDWEKHVIFNCWDIDRVSESLILYGANSRRLSTIMLTRKSVESSNRIRR